MTQYGTIKFQWTKYYDRAILMPDTLSVEVRQFVPRQFVPRQFVPDNSYHRQFVPRQFVPRQFVPRHFVPNLIGQCVTYV